MSPRQLREWRAAYPGASTASHCGSNTSASRPPHGLRVRLNAGFDVTGYSGATRTLLTVLKRYGLMLADQGSAWSITGTSDPGWEDALDQLRAQPVHGRDFEVVQMGLLTTC